MKNKWLKRMITALLILAIALVGAVKFPLIWREVTFHWTEHTEAELRVKAYADEMGVSYWKYPESLIDLLERNPETEEFVLEYPFREEREPEVFTYDLTEGVPLMMQWDKRWGYENYAGSIMALSGCGPVCLSMVSIYLTGNTQLTPSYIAEFATENGYATYNNGTKWTLMSEGAEELGLVSQELPLDKDIIINALKGNKPVIMIMGEGDFTTGGHFITVVGYDEDGFTVLDPNSREKSSGKWPYERIESQIRNIWCYSVIM